MAVKVGTPHSFHYFASVRALIIVLLTGLVTSPTDAAAPKPAAGAGAGILHVRGTDIVDAKGRPVVLRGVAFGNQVWNNVRLPRRDHDETDYQRVAAMGMNAVRFYMNYRTFENDAAPGKYLDDGWQWLDDNVAWAKRHGVYLILNMHVPPGGFQSLGNGKALWDRPEAQDRLIALWTAIARHCKGEPTVAGYDLLNEPVVTKAASQWHDLAARVAAAIRAVDGDHMLKTTSAASSASPIRTRSTNSTSTSRFTSRTRARRGCRSRPRTSAIPTPAPRSNGSCSIARPGRRRARSCRPATARGRSTRARRFESTIPRSSSASRC
jgi:hypothetical protein